MMLSNTAPKRVSLLSKFSDLPPRVIIIDILTFHLMEVGSIGVECNNENETRLFGYFSKDGLRNIWFVFRSLAIETSFLREGEKIEVLLDFERIFHLTFDYYCGNLIKNLIEESPKMFSLESLEGGYSRGFCKGWYSCGFYVAPGPFSRDLKGLFSTPGCFPKLKKMRMSHFHPGELDFRFFDWEPFNWGQLKTFEFKLLPTYTEKERSISLLFRKFCEKCKFHSIFVNVKRFSVRHFMRMSHPYPLDLPKAEIIDIRYSIGKNALPLEVNIGPNLRVLKLYSLNSEFVNNLVLKLRPEELSLGKMDDIDLKSMFSESSKCITKLKKLKLLEINNENVQSGNEILFFGKNLKVLSILTTAINEESFLHEYPKLKVFSLWKCHDRMKVSRKWPFLEKVEVLNIRSNFLVSTEVFPRINVFPSLEKMSIYDIPSLRTIIPFYGMSGHHWNAFRRLKELVVSSGFDDDFFIGRFDLQKTLTYLKLFRCRKILGNWEGARFGRLKKFV